MEMHIDVGSKDGKGVNIKLDTQSRHKQGRKRRNKRERVEVNSKVNIGGGRIKGAKGGKGDRGVDIKQIYEKDVEINIKKQNK